MLSEDTKAIVASNLTIARTLLYAEYARQGKQESEQVIQKWFKQSLDLLNQDKK